MTWYAQRGEDRYLRTLLGERDPGFYIDVGAHDATIDSVTKHFYDRGWHGINIEPVAEYLSTLVRDRPRDINLACAIDKSSGTREIIVIAGTGLSTFDRAIADCVGVGRVSEKRSISVYTLSEIIKYHAHDTRIDFLKIDVEGWERQVLLSNDWKKYRPRFLCIEATYPLTDEPSHESWEPFLLMQDYKFLHFDGLNRYYADARP